MRLIKAIVCVFTIVVGLASLVSFIIFASNGNQCIDDEGFPAKLNTWIYITTNMILSILCVLFTIYLIYSYRNAVNHFVSLQSKRNFGIVIVCSIILVFEMFVRVAFHLYHPITKRFMNIILFRSGTHYFPDSVEYVIISLLLHHSHTYE